MTDTSIFQSSFIEILKIEFLSKSMGAAYLINMYAEIIHIKFVVCIPMHDSSYYQKYFQKTIFIQGFINHYPPSTSCNKSNTLEMHTA